MLYLYVIQKRASPPETYNSYFSAAIRCQSHISSIAEKGSLPERYCLVLEELRVEALRQTERMHQLTSVKSDLQRNRPQTMSIGMEANLGGPTDFADFMGDFDLDYDDVPGSVPSDYSGWDQFASMVSSGLGNLDGFFNDDPFVL